MMVLSRVFLTFFLVCGVWAGNETFKKTKLDKDAFIQLVEPMVLQTEIMCSVECLLLDDCTAFTFEESICRVGYIDCASGKQNSLLYLFLLSSLHVVDGCPICFTRSAGICWMRTSSGIKKTWQGMVNFCESVHSFIPMPTNQDMINTILSITNSEPVWLGSKNVMKTMTGKWLDGSEYALNNGKRAQKNCIYMDSSLDDQNCANVLPGICVKPQ
ncbi:uncharacterized protein LOC111700192 isoform X1 [Eurytemora carolleeae]|uniref:uncharacterized protein LOC111700192 isoform X1 n=1 Tax=Eurytemora carolleeae TaxID=1294199 RepID=UPI000C764F53|nr:uncharacterized protein LOC111700192 isoform X1 [Eurytemora carolleeae]|eukprot:XP_023326808.1 uncharacterized protein LOC111700192 isoform X1 [Eurytemora affinis]